MTLPHTQARSIDGAAPPDRHREGAPPVLAPDPKTARRPPLLQVQGVSYAYGSAQPPVLRGIDLDVGFGERVAIVGQNGSGKSTLLRVIEGMLRPKTGHVLLYQRPVAFGAHYPGIRVVADFGHETENLGLPSDRRVHDVCAVFERLHANSPAARAEHDRLDQVLQIDALRDRYIGDLSTGQYKKVQWKLALSSPADLLLLDEAFSGLDDACRAWLMAELERPQRAGLALLTITHDPDEVDRLAGRAYRLEAGRLTPLPMLPRVTYRVEIARGEGRRSMLCRPHQWQGLLRAELEGRAPEAFVLRATPLTPDVPLKDPPSDLGGRPPGSASIPSFLHPL